MSGPSRKVAYVLSSNFSGSTLLALHMAGFENAYLVGEAAYVYRKNKSGDWRHRKFCTPCGTKNQARQCPVWGDEVVEQLRQRPADYFPILSGRIKEPVGLWVDSSKDLDWIRHQQGQQADGYVIHITKSMQGFLGSLINRERTKGGLGFQAFLWAKQNLQYAQFATQQNLPYLHVRYEDFVTEPDAVLDKIASFLEEKHRPQAPYWEREMHFVKGNPAAAVAFQPSLAQKQVGLNADLYADGGRGLFLDEKWKKLLTYDQVKSLYTLPLVRRASEAFGYPTPPEVDQAKRSSLLNLQYRLQTSLHTVYSTPRHVY